ncbi:MAG: mannose-6-phosphate isomerase [Fibrobacter sp.]|nr:mannose-6-phosphate isomerase [Fibrobacter sp.]
MLYPLKFRPLYKEKIWGGQSFKQIFDKDIPFSHTGEVWNVACHNRGMSIVSEGRLKDKSLQYIFENFRQELIGASYIDFDKFPLLIKLIDAKERLSLQVHPQNEYARINEKGERGKSEMWYVLKAKKGAKLVVGLKDNITKEQFEHAIKSGGAESCINEITVKEGDIINIPAGLIHSIGEDIVLIEVQQNSDLVYRVFDWNRLDLDERPRMLHIKKALDVIDFKGRLKKELIKGLSITNDHNSITYYVANPHFAVQKISLDFSLHEDTCGEKMIIYTGISGTFSIKWNDTSTIVGSGESVLIPASLGKFIIEGRGELIKSFIPDIVKDFVQPLKNAGYSEEEIFDNTAVTFE